MIIYKGKESNSQQDTNSQQAQSSQRYVPPSYKYIGSCRNGQMTKLKHTTNPKQQNLSRRQNSSKRQNSYTQHNRTQDQTQTHEKLKQGKNVTCVKYESRTSHMSSMRQERHTSGMRQEHHMCLVGSNDHKMGFRKTSKSLNTKRGKIIV